MNKRFLDDLDAFVHVEEVSAEDVRNDFDDTDVIKMHYGKRRYYCLRFLIDRDVYARIDKRRSHEMSQFTEHLLDTDDHMLVKNRWWYWYRTDGCLEYRGHLTTSGNVIASQTQNIHSVARVLKNMRDKCVLVATFDVIRHTFSPGLRIDFISWEHDGWPYHCAIGTSMGFTKRACIEQARGLLNGAPINVSPIRDCIFFARCRPEVLALLRLTVREKEIAREAAKAVYRLPLF